MESSSRTDQGSDCLSALLVDVCAHVFSCIDLTAVSHSALICPFWSSCTTESPSLFISDPRHGHVDSLAKASACPRRISGAQCEPHGELLQWQAQEAVNCDRLVRQTWSLSFSTTNVCKSSIWTTSRWSLKSSCCWSGHSEEKKIKNGLAIVGKTMDLLIFELRNMVHSYYCKISPCMLCLLFKYNENGLHR